MTAKDQDGKELLNGRRKYDNWNLWFKGGKWVELRQWDITAATNVNLGLEPEQTDSETYVVILDKNTKAVTIEVKFLYEHEPDHWETVKTVTKTLKVEPPKKFVKQ